MKGNFFPFIYLFIHLKVRVTQEGLRGREKGRRGLLHLMIRFLDDHHDQGWAESKPGAKSFIRVSHVVAAVQILEPSSAAFP